MQTIDSNCLPLDLLPTLASDLCQNRNAACNCSYHRAPSAFARCQARPARLLPALHRLVCVPTRPAMLQDYHHVSCSLSRGQLRIPLPSSRGICLAASDSPLASAYRARPVSVAEVPQVRTLAPPPGLWVAGWVFGKGASTGTATLPQFR